MRARLRSSAISRFAGVVTTVWLCSNGPAWAGDGGSDTAVQPALNAVCAAVGVTSCPHMPTVTQVILQISGLGNAAPDFVRGPQGSFNIPPNATGALCVVIPSSSFSGLSACNQIVIDALNPPAASSVGASDLASLTPLAFTTGKGAPVPVTLDTSGASSFFYAVATPDQNGEFKTLTLFFDYPVQTNSSIQKSVFAKISLPLQVLNNDGTERLICGATPCPSVGSLPPVPPVLATLQISGCSSGAGCVNGLAANVVGDFSTPGTFITMSASSLDIGVSVSFAPSPNSASSHLILTVQVPLLVTHGRDPAYFGVPSGGTLVNQLSGLPTAFTSNVVPASGIGVTPQAAPVCNEDCPATTFVTTFPFCASFAGSGSGPLGSGSFHSAVAAFLSVGTDATTYVSSPVSPAALSGVQLQCPF